MISPATCNHFSINAILCRFCGTFLCDKCRKEHESQHIANDDKEIIHG